MTADLILTNGVVYTVDERRSRHEALAVRDGRIVALGTAAEITELAGPATTVIDLAGRLVLPGFIDAHMHASSAADVLLDLQLGDCESLDDCLESVRRFAAEHPDLPVVRGNGWVDSYMPPAGPSAAALDALVADRPVALYDDSYHAVWVNSLALRLAGVDASTPDPESGVIERSPDGAPSGTLREAPALLVERVLPARTPKEARAGILYFQDTVAGRYGLTTVQDAGLLVGRDDAVLTTFESLQEEGRLSARYCLSLALRENEPLAEQIEAAAEERARHAGPLVTAAWAKLFADGVIEGHTAVLKEPYADRPGFRGEPVWSAGQMEAASVAAARAGFKLHYHAIGDGAVSDSLDAIAAAARACGGRVRRPLITHMELVDPTDLLRFAELGVVAVVQAYWFLKEGAAFWERTAPYLGLARAERRYPMRSFWDHGIVAASASDYPVSPPPDPLVAIRRGVLRRDSEQGDALWPEEAVTVERMIESWTINSAYALDREDEVGSLACGKIADLVVLSRDILSIPPDEISTAAVELTVFGGRPVYASGPFAGIAG